MQTGYEHQIQNKVGQTSTNRILDKLHHSTSVETLEIIDENRDRSLEFTKGEKNPPIQNTTPPVFVLEIHQQKLTYLSIFTGKKHIALNHCSPSACHHFLDDVPPCLSPNLPSFSEFLPAGLEQTNIKHLLSQTSHSNSLKHFIP